MTTDHARRAAEIRRAYGHLDRLTTTSDEDAVLDLLAAYDDAEAWCARLANDREGETALVEAGVAKAIGAIRDHDGPNLISHAEAMRIIHDACGPAALPPHEETLAENRRLRAALAEIVGAWEAGRSTCAELVRALRGPIEGAGRAALRGPATAPVPDPLN